MAKNPFQIDDKVFVMPHGWGVVDMIHTDCVRVKFHDNIPVTPQFFDLKYVSFTEYDPIKGGLSHDREDYVVPGSLKESKQKALNALAEQLDKIGKASEEAAKSWGVKFGLPHGNVDRRSIDSTDVIPAEIAQRNLKALEYIKKLLKDNYNVVDDYIGVEDLGSEVNVSLTFRKG